MVGTVPNSEEPDINATQAPSRDCGPSVQVAAGGLWNPPFASSPPLPADSSSSGQQKALSDYSISCVSQGLR